MNTAGAYRPGPTVPASGEGGFTLLEVMASVAILGIAVVAVIQLFSGSLNIARSSREYVDMVVFAREKMAEVSMKEDVLSADGASGSEKDGLSWSVSVKRFTPPDGAAATFDRSDVYEVSVSVNGQGTRRREFAMTTLKAVPRPR